MGRKPQEIKLTVVPADIPPEEAVERCRKATEILLRIEERVNRKLSMQEPNVLLEWKGDSSPILQGEPAMGGSSSSAAEATHEWLK